MKYEDNPKSIKYHVKKFILEHASRFKDKTVVDFPAGNGISSRIVKEVGGRPLPFDLFPEFFKIKGLDCTKADILEGIPLEDSKSDWVICQEGIEHFSDQAKSFKEFNRILKNGGRLLMTTPNYSNLRAKVSYLLSESERFNSKMPPNEIDSIWMSNKKASNEVYYGHIFLIGIQKLRVLAKLSGFKIERIVFTRIKSTSLLLLPILYPFILLSNAFTYFKNMRKDKNVDANFKKGVYGEIFRLSIDPKILIDGHLFIEFKKEGGIDEVAAGFVNVHKEFGIT